MRVSTKNEESFENIFGNIELFDKISMKSYFFYNFWPNISGCLLPFLEYTPLEDNTIFSSDFFYFRGGGLKFRFHLPPTPLSFVSRSIFPIQLNFVDLVIFFPSSSECGSIGACGFETGMKWPYVEKFNESSILFCLEYQ